MSSADLPPSRPRRVRGRRRRRRDLALLLSSLAALGLLAGLWGGQLRWLPLDPGRSGPAAARAIARRAAVAGGGSRLELTTDWVAGNPGPAFPDVRGVAAILVDASSREVLWERQPDAPRAPASLAKLVTAMVAADLAPLDQEITVVPEADARYQLGIESSATLMGLSAGERLTVQELLYGVFLRSGNDAAEALARGIVNRDRFIAAMNSKAAELGMTESHFTSPVGLDDPGMRSSAHDLAVAAVAIETRYPALARIAATLELHLPATATHKEFDGESWLHSFLVGYPGASGLKTGYTDDAGGCVVATAGRGSRHLVAVVLGSPTFVTDAERLLDYGFGLSPTP